MTDIENPLITCSICLEENIERDNLCKTNCNHAFCKKCIDGWFDRGTDSCPLCRNKIKYFEYKNEKNRIITIEKPGQNNLNIERVNRLLILRNTQLKWYLFLSLSTTINFMINYYLCSSRYQDLNIELGLCETNNTILSGELDDLMNEYNDYIPISVFKKDYVPISVFNDDSYTKCSIPRIFYNQCFNF
jgi:hypothetical protein